MTDRTAVIYVASAPASGSTTVGSLLGELEGAFFAGEMRFVWDRLLKGGRCGCGQPLKTCSVWQPILPNVDNGAARFVEELARAADSHSLIRTAPIATLRNGLAQAARVRSPRKELDTVSLYTRLSRNRDIRWIVDTSKSPSYGLALAESPHITLHVVHLVRDPRAVVHSTLMRHHNIDDYGKRFKALAYYSTKWITWNAWIQTALRGRSASYTLVRYEDFCRAPSEALRRIARAVGCSMGAGFPLADGDAMARLNKNHSVFGNGVRFRNGLVPIKLDETWKEEMPRRERFAVAAIAMPFMRRYQIGADTDQGGNQWHRRD
jgi:hypothetical protein